LAGCLTKTRKVGGSIVVTLPKHLVQTQKIKENEFVEITIKKCQKDGFGIFKGMGSFTVEDELKTFE
jgi:antitoxin component of MazEF toxin-antitoxin module